MGERWRAESGSRKMECRMTEGQPARASFFRPPRSLASAAPLACPKPHFRNDEKFRFPCACRGAFFPSNMKPMFNAMLLVGLFTLRVSAQTALDRNSPSKMNLNDLPSAMTWHGVVYHVTDVVEAYDEMVILATDRGPLKMPSNDLPPSVVKRFGAKIEKSIQAAAAEKRKALGIEDVSGKVVQVVGDALLLRRISDDKMILLRGYKAQAVDGDFVRAEAQADGVFQYKTVLGAASTVRAFKCLR